MHIINLLEIKYILFRLSRTKAIEYFEPEMETQLDS